MDDSKPLFGDDSLVGDDVVDGDDSAATVFGSVAPDDDDVGIDDVDFEDVNRDGAAGDEL